MFLDIIKEELQSILQEQNEQSLSKIAGKVWDMDPIQDNGHPIIQITDNNYYHGYLDRWGIRGNVDLGWRIISKQTGASKRREQIFDDFEEALNRVLELER